jgi:hypothetical protein
LSAYDTYGSERGSLAVAPPALDVLQRVALWLFVFSGWYVVVEPAPYEFLFLVALLLHVPAGLSIHRSASPLVLFLILFLLGGFASLVPVLYLPKTAQYFLVSFYMAMASIFICFCITADPVRRTMTIRNAWICAAVVASILGMIGYFKIAGMGEAWAPSWRAQGTFKDPNVLSTFLVPPAVFLIHGFVLGTQRHRILSAIALAIILAGIFLAFSRGAWFNTLASVILLFGLTFYLAPTWALRTRLVLAAAIGFALTLAALSFALTFDAVRNIFELRASLVQTYDAGEYGRFGNQLRSLSYLVESPNGFGPFQFAAMFGKDPHNVFVNAFAAYGWLGGFSYLLLCIATIAAGLKAAFMRTPWQAFSIAAICPMVSMIFQGIQIDTDHWRHFYLLLGMVWGLFAASVAQARTAEAEGNRAEITEDGESSGPRTGRIPQSSQ